MPDASPSAVKTGSVSVQYADGTKRTLPVHGITLFQIMDLLDELGVKDFNDLEFKGSASLMTMRFMQKAAALALSFPSVGDIWTVERIRKEFADLGEVAKVFAACVGGSNLPQPQTRANPEKTRKGGAYS